MRLLPANRRDYVVFDRSVPQYSRPSLWHGVYPDCAVRLFDQWWLCTAIYFEDYRPCHELVWIPPLRARAMGLPK